MRRTFILSTAAAALLLALIAVAPNAGASDELPVHDPAAAQSFEAEFLEISYADPGAGAGNPSGPMCRRDAAGAAVSGYSAAMARYQIELDDESLIEADDARFVAGGRFLEVIPRKAATSGGAPERLILNSSVVRAVHFKPIGFKGGWRFDGGKDSSFDPSEGSV